MVICRGKLDQPLQKLLHLRLGGEPELFPRLMRLPELARVEVGNSFAEAIFEYHRVLQ